MNASVEPKPIVAFPKTWHMTHYMETLPHPKCILGLGPPWPGYSRGHKTRMKNEKNKSNKQHVPAQKSKLPSLPSTLITWRFSSSIPLGWAGPRSPRCVFVPNQTKQKLAPSHLGPRFPWFPKSPSPPTPHVPRQLHPRHIHMHPLTESTLSCEEK